MATKKQTSRNTTKNSDQPGEYRRDSWCPYRSINREQYKTASMWVHQYDKDYKDMKNDD